MREITRKRIVDAKAVHKDSATALEVWFQMMRRGQFESFAQLKAAFGSVDRFAHLHIFDVGGNKLRIIVSIHFATQIVFVRYVLTHKQYDEEGWKRRELEWKRKQEQQ